MKLIITEFKVIFNHFKASCWNEKGVQKIYIATSGWMYGGWEKDFYLIPMGPKKLAASLYTARGLKPWISKIRK